MEVPAFVEFMFRWGRCNKLIYIACLVVIIAMGRLKEYILGGDQLLFYIRLSGKCSVISDIWADNWSIWGSKPYTPDRYLEETERSKNTHRKVVAHLEASEKNSRKWSRGGVKVADHLWPCRLWQSLVLTLKMTRKTRGEFWVEWHGLTWVFKDSLWVWFRFLAVF